MPDFLALLLTERDRMDRAIAALGGDAPRRRGRPPKAGSGGKLPKRRKPRSAASRKAQSRRMRAYWAAKRKQKKG